jgi:Holliday junction resolvase
MGAHSRNKGARAEREIARILLEYGYLGAMRGQQRSGLEQADVIGLPGWHIESKRTERVALWAAWAQANRDCPRGSKPLVVTRKNKEPWLAVLTFEAFLDLLARIEDLERAVADAVDRMVTLRHGQDAATERVRLPDRGDAPPVDDS